MGMILNISKDFKKDMIKKNKINLVREPNKMNQMEV